MKQTIIEKKIKVILQQINDIVNNYYLDKWRKNKSTNFIIQYDNKNEDISITHKVWNWLNIKKNTFIQIIKIQENWIFIRTRNAIITKNISNKYYKYCKV